MKKKNLIILLLIPFLISLVGIITINISINTFYGDITSIKWDYDDVEAFKLTNKKYKLQATAYNASNAPLDAGNSLIWTCENINTDIDPVAEIVYEKDAYYLNTLTSGEITIMCSNFKGNVFRKMNAIIYENGAIIMTPVISSSQNNIDENIYYGQYDLVNNEKKKAEVEFNVKIFTDDKEDTNNMDFLVESSSNVTFNAVNKKLTINEPGDAYFSLKFGDVSSNTYKFKVVENGVNVYSYEDLLACTNKSETGEIIVLRKSFDTSDTVNNLQVNNIEIFGNYSNSEKRYMFENDVYVFETTYNQEYIKQWNNFAKDSSNYFEISNKIIAGLRVQKDFYGNGYSINLHNLTYPSKSYSAEGYDFPIPELAETDLFRGPKSFYTLGDPNGLPLVTAYGQDNVGMYLDGNNITVNDLNIRNCDLMGSISFLDTVGTVIEVNGDNNTIRNSRLSNGKNVLRCFSTENFILDNSLLSNSRNFLLEVGSNEYLTYDEINEYEFTNSNGEKVMSKLDDYLGISETNGDEELNNYLLGSFEDSSLMRASLESIQNALNQNDATKDIYKASLVINDTYFYNSGIASISLESMFNGPFLYSSSPSVITSIFSMFQDSSNQSIIPYTPIKIGGVSYPVKVDLVGDTRFYDYKESSNIDITGLINENISLIANEVLGEERSINIDTIFPIKPLLLEKARKQSSSFNSEGKEYLNIPIVYYGGGSNLSKVNVDNLDNKDKLSETIEINFLDEYMNPSSTDDMISLLKEIALKSVTVVTGFEPFKFVCLNSEGYLFGKGPNVNDLIQNAKGV